MSQPEKYPEELVERGVRLALESGRPIAHIAADLGMHSETMRKRVRQAEADGGGREAPARPCSAQLAGRASSTTARRFCSALASVAG